MSCRLSPSLPSRSRHAYGLYAAALVLFAGLAGCDEEDDATRYFPLDAGVEWQYQLKRTTMDGTHDLRYIIATARAAQVGDIQAAVREIPVGRRYFYARTDEGIVRVASGRREGNEFVIVPQRELVLPAKLRADSTWTSATQTAVLENTGPPWETLFRITVPVAMHYRVESLSATVETPAGRFTDCLVVSGVGNADTDVGNYIGQTAIEVVTTEWFAPDVGLVRLERSEQTTASAISAGQLTMELDRWRAD